MTDFERIKLSIRANLDYARRIHIRTGDIDGANKLQDMIDHVAGETECNIDNYMRSQKISAEVSYQCELEKEDKSGAPKAFAWLTTINNVYGAYQNNVRRLNGEKKTTSSWKEISQTH